MAGPYYVYSGATGSGNGSSWANAYTTLAAATAVMVSGETSYIAHDHVENTTGALAITSPASDSTPCRLYCVDRAGSVPPVSADLRTTAQVNATGAITVNASFSEIYGIKFSTGDGTATSASFTLGNTAQRGLGFKKCHFKLNNTSTSSRINAPASQNAAWVNFDDCTFEFLSTSHCIVTAGRCTIRNGTSGTIVGATVPTGLCQFGVGGEYFLEGLDLSAITTGKNVFGASVVNNPRGVVKDCKLGAGGGISSVAASFGGLVAIGINCDSGDNITRHEKVTFNGTETTETTIVRTGGASDGATPFSRKIVTPATVCRPELPFECMPISIWNDTVGSPITITLYGAKSGGLPNNSQVWMDVYYQGTTGFPQAVRATNGRADNLANATTYSDAGQTWGGGLTDDFAMQVTVTPREKGPITIYPKFGVSSTTMYIDPKPVIT